MGILNKDAVGKFIIIKDLKFTDFMKNDKGEINLYDSYDDAMLTCGMYEFPDVLIVEVKANYVEEY